MPTVAFSACPTLQVNPYDRCQSVKQISTDSVRNFRLRDTGALVNGAGDATVGQFTALGNN